MNEDKRDDRGQKKNNCRKMKMKEEGKGYKSIKRFKEHETGWKRKKDEKRGLTKMKEDDRE